MSATPPSPPVPNGSLFTAYRSLVSAGDIKRDPAQEEAATVLQDFADHIKNQARASPATQHGFKAFLDRLLWDENPASAVEPENAKLGIYIYGTVGRGKSMLMDLFMEHVEVPKKRRVHFHQFMLEIHARLHKLRQSAEADIMDRLCRDLAAETSLLAFDEFHVNNIADAMILGRLFSGLFDQGVLMVATSNSAPDELYKNGLQRDRFVPFIDLIKRRMTLFPMQGRTDYRFEQIRHIRSYFCPLGLETTRKLQGIFIDLTHDTAAQTITLPVEGRELALAHTAQGVGFFNFDELCSRALGAADYLAIASCLHTIVLDGVTLKTERRDEAVRFMTLIDTMYEAKAQLFMASSLPIERLTVAEDIAPAFQRTVSRLMEMQGDAYRLKSHLGPA